MVRGLCSRCRREVGGWRSILWQCPECRKLYCDLCPRKRVGWWRFKRPVCPECLVEMKEGGVEQAGRQGMQGR